MALRGRGWSRCDGVYGETSSCCCCCCCCCMRSVGCFALGWAAGKLSMVSSRQTGGGSRRRGGSRGGALSVAMRNEVKRCDAMDGIEGMQRERERERDEWIEWATAGGGLLLVDNHWQCFGPSGSRPLCLNRRTRAARSLANRRRLELLDRTSLSYVYAAPDFTLLGEPRLLSGSSETLVVKHECE